MFYLAQIFGVIALIILIISFQKDNKDSLLKYQIFSSLFFAVQYLCLGAISGWLISLITLIRNIVYKKVKDTPFIIVLLIITIMVILSLYFYTGWISILPTIAAILYTIAVWQKNLRITRIAEIISCLLFIIYNINVLAISGLISTIIELIFAIVAVYRFDIKIKK